MPLSADRVKETTSTTGTGTVTLAGAATGFRTFASAFTVGDQVYYCIAAGAEWEVGIGSLTTSSTLSRTTVLASSNANALVSFSAGSKDVFATMPYSRLSQDVYVSDTAPTDTSIQFWYDSVSGNLFIRYNDGDSTQWVTASNGVLGDPGITVSASAPSSPALNQLWLAI